MGHKLGARQGRAHSRVSNLEPKTLFALLFPPPLKRMHWVTGIGSGLVCQVGEGGTGVSGGTGGATCLVLEETALQQAARNAVARRTARERIVEILRYKPEARDETQVETLTTYLQQVFPALPAERLRAVTAHTYVTEWSRGDEVLLEGSPCHAERSRSQLLFS